MKWNCGRIVLIVAGIAWPFLAMAQRPIEVDPRMGIEAPTVDERAAEGDVVVARIGNEEIRLTDIVGEIYSLPAEQREAQPFDDLYDEFLQRRIDHAMVFYAAVASGLRNDPRHARRMAEIERSVLADQYLDNIIRARITIEAVEERYEIFVEEEADRTELRARHILARDAVHADKLKLRLDNGEDFEALARSLDYPGAEHGGDLGYFDEETMASEIVQVARTLEVDQISAPFESQFGWHLLKLVDERPTRVREFDEVRDQLVQDMSREIVDDVIAALRGQIPVERFNRDGSPIDAASSAEEASPVE